jgi:hypothetical protein
VSPPQSTVSRPGIPVDKKEEVELFCSIVMEWPISIYLVEIAAMTGKDRTFCNCALQKALKQTLQAK